MECYSAIKWKKLLIYAKSTDKSQLYYAKWEKKDTEGYTLHNSIYMIGKEDTSVGTKNKPMQILDAASSGWRRYYYNQAKGTFPIIHEKIN